MIPVRDLNILLPEIALRQVLVQNRGVRDDLETRLIIDVRENLLGLSFELVVNLHYLDIVSLLDQILDLTLEVQNVLLVGAVLIFFLDIFLDLMGEPDLTRLEILITRLHVVLIIIVLYFGENRSLLAKFSLFLSNFEIGLHLDRWLTRTRFLLNAWVFDPGFDDHGGDVVVEFGGVVGEDELTWPRLDVGGVLEHLVFGIQGHLR